MDAGGIHQQPDPVFLAVVGITLIIFCALAWLIVDALRWLRSVDERPPLANYGDVVELPPEAKAAAGTKGGAGGRAEPQSQPPHTHAQHTGPQSHLRTED